MSTETLDRPAQAVAARQDPRDRRAPAPLDLRPQAEPALPPANVEAEQALIGSLLYDAGTHERIAERIAAEDFYEPIHGRLFEAIDKAVKAGRVADPTALASQFANDPAYNELGGVRYLADLVDRSPPAANARGYADLIRDLAKRRAIITLSGEMAERARVGDPDDPALAQIEGAEQALFALSGTDTSSGGGLRDFEHFVTQAVEGAADAYQRDGGLSGLATGLTDLDAKLGGLHKSDLIIIGARPSMGKSALATCLAFHVARRYAFQAELDGTRKTTAGGVVAFFSLEMSGDQLALRILGDVADVPSDKIRKGLINAHEFGRIRDAATEIHSAPLHIDATGAISIGRLATRARRLKRTVGLDLIVVDYLQLCTTDRRRNGGSRVEEVSEITQALKALAKDLDVPVVALAQLSRALEGRDDKRPQLADLRESGSIEQDADVVIFIYREEYYVGRTQPKEGTDEHIEWQAKMDACHGLADLIIGKARHGPIGVVKVAFDERLAKFSNLARGDV